MSALENCPICGTTSTRRISESLRHCPSCSVSFNASYHPLEYNDSYFLDEYEKQYGRTYEQDFSTIYAVSKQRLQKILSCFPVKEYHALRLLDVGSAMGFFLKAASDMGVGEVTGMEISRYASEYCTKTFGFPVIQEAFRPEKIPGHFDIITAWFFIEHCQDPVQVIKDLYDKLKAPGILALSVPSIFGPQYLFHRKEWAAAHPDDHRIDFSPASLKNVLRKNGFNKIYFYPGGFHPERVISSRSLLFRPFSVLYRHVTHILSFSDTLEAYAVKK